MSINDHSGEQRKTWKLFSVAVIFALLDGLGTILYLKSVKNRLEARLQPEEQQMVSVIVASSDLPVGSTISTDTVAVRKVPVEYVNSDVLTPDQFDSFEGALLTKPLAHGKMLTQDYIDLNLPKYFSGTIKLGYRAITIQVGEINSISGLIRPGDVIDLYARMDGGAIAVDSSGTGGEIILPVLENVLVLATDKRSARPNEDEFRNLQERDSSRSYDTLTLEVTPEEAALLTLAESRGSLVAALRNIRDTGGVAFSRIGLGDLVAHSQKLRTDANNKLENKSLDGVHKDAQGRLVTKDGTVITDPNVMLNKEGLLVTKDGTVLSGRGLKISADGKIRTRDGKEVATATLLAGKDGTLIDRNGTVVSTNGFHSVKGGFLADDQGNIMTNDGQILHGVRLDKDGTVRTADGTVLSAENLVVGSDGKVYLKGAADNLHVDPDGTVRDVNGNVVDTADLISVDKDGVVRTKDGTILKGVHMGEDGILYSADGKKMDAADVLTAAGGYTAGKDGTVVDAAGHVKTAKDLVTVDADGTVRTADGTILAGVTRDEDGNLRDRDGRILTAQDVVKREALAHAGAKALDGVVASYDPQFAGAVAGYRRQGPGSSADPYEVEYIIGGSSDGAATTYRVKIEELQEVRTTN